MGSSQCHAKLSEDLEEADEVSIDWNPFCLIIKPMKKAESSFEEFEATSLYCPRCKTAVPVRKKLLLVLPEGDEYEYLCVHCSSSVGMKVDKTAPPTDLILMP